MKIFQFLVLALIITKASGKFICQQPCPPQITKGNLNFTAWDNTLKLITYPGSINDINVTLVNYTALINNTDFNNFGWQIQTANLTHFNGSEWYSFWINTYNFMSVWMVYENSCDTDLFGNCRPLRSIRDIGQQQPSLIVNTVWGLKLLYLDNDNDSPLSLKDIEDKKLRNFTQIKMDVRFHFCISCASVSGPNLRAEAYVVDRLDEQMNNSTLEFLKDKTKGAIIKNNMLTLSPIFSWFLEDFTNSTDFGENLTTIDITHFLYTFAPDDVYKWLVEYSQTNVPLYFNYDWSLNGNTKELCGLDRVCFPLWALIVTILCSLGLLLVLIGLIVKRRNKYILIQ